MTTATETESLEVRYEKANEAVEKAMERRDDAIHALIDAEMKYADALDAWAPLYNQIRAGDSSGVTEAALKRRRKMN
jgi:hypothetical protein